MTSSEIIKTLKYTFMENTNIRISVLFIFLRNRVY